MSLENNIPKHWQVKKLGDICKFVRGPFGGSLKKENFQSDGFAVYEQQHAIYNQYDNIRYFIAESKFNEMKRFELKSGDLIMSCSGTMGKVSIVPKNIKKGIINQALLKLSPSEHVSIFFLKTWMESLNFQESLKSFSKGAAIQNVASVAVLKNIKIPLPPLPEQQAIVAKIEELIRNLENGKQQLLTAQQQLKIYRQSLLKAAFEGKLTNKDVKDGELPKGWKWVKIGSFLSDKKKGMATGPFGTMLKKSEHQKYGIPVLGIENIGEGVFQMPNKIFITKEKAVELKSFSVNENDIIISRSGTVGEICLLPKRMEGSIISTNLIRVTLNQKIISPKYFVYLFQGGKVRQQVYELCKGSSRAFLNQTILNSLDFPLCSLEEQQLIVDELESKLTVCDKIEETITQCLQQAEMLKQSILKRAFEGKLIQH